MFALAAVVQANANSDDPLAQLEHVTSLVYNLEVKKLILGNAEKIQVYRSRNDWSDILKKIIAKSMTLCMRELRDFDKMEKVLKAAEKQDMTKHHMPFMDKISVDKIVADNSFDLSLEEQEIYDKYEKSDIDVKQSEEGKKAREAAEDTQEL